MSAAVAVGLLLRLPGLGDGLDHDEAYTWESFASRSAATIATHYPVPNNHILHSLLVKASASAFGEGETALRLPALAAGLLGIPAAWWLARAVTGGCLAPALAAWALALAPSHVAGSQVARGYTLLVLLSALAGGCLLRAQGGGYGHGGDRRWWAAYALALFLALYTQPSAALLAAALALWSVGAAWRSADSGLLRASLAAHGAVLVAAGVAYWPIFGRVLAAGRDWGIDLHAGGLAAFGALAAGVAGALPGGRPGAILLAVALFGAARVVRAGGDRRWLVVSLVAVSVLLPLLHGIAPQPRGYLFLLPWVAVAAAHGVACLAAGLPRGALAALALGGLAVTSVPRAMAHETDPGWRDLGRTLASRTGRGEVLVAPYLMDVEVLHYARPAIQRGVVTALMDGTCSLLLAADRGDGRFDLEAYPLVSETTQDRQVLGLPRTAFDVAYQSGGRVVYRLRGTGRSMMPPRWQWNGHPEEVAGIEFGASGAAVTTEGGLALRNPLGRPFRIYSDVRFRPEAAGLCVLVAARTDPRSEVSLYLAGPGQRPEAAAGPERVTELHMLLTAAQPVRAVGRDDQLWHLEAFLVPVAADRDYGVYLRGTETALQAFADIRVFFFPWPATAG